MPSIFLILVFSSHLLAQGANNGTEINLVTWHRLSEDTVLEVLPSGFKLTRLCNGQPVSCLQFSQNEKIKTVKVTLIMRNFRGQLKFPEESRIKIYNFNLCIEEVATVDGQVVKASAFWEGLCHLTTVATGFLYTDATHKKVLPDQQFWERVTSIYPIERGVYQQVELEKQGKALLPLAMSIQATIECWQAMQAYNEAMAAGAECVESWEWQEPLWYEEKAHELLGSETPVIPLYINAELLALIKKALHTSSRDFCDIAGTDICPKID